MSQKLAVNSVHMDFVRNLPLFNGLNDNEKDLLLEGGDVHSYPRKNALFIQGDPISSFYIVCNGTVQLFRATPDGHEVTTNIRSVGDTICEKEIFSADNLHNVSAVAIDNVDVVKLPAEKVKANAEKCGAFSRNLLFAIAQSATTAEVEAEHRSTMTSSQIISCYLQHLCVLYGYEPEGFNLPYKKSLIASRIGMELETFSRALPKLRHHGITVKGPHVAFHDFSAVDAHACGNCSVSDFCSVNKAIRKKANSG